MLRSSCVSVGDKVASFPGGIVRLRLTHVWGKLMNQVMRLKAEKQLTSNDVVVAVYLMDAMDNDTGTAARKLATIAAATGICKDEVIKSIKRLVEHGVVDKEVRRNQSDTKQASNHYHWPGFGAAEGHEKGDRVSPFLHGQGARGDTVSPRDRDQVGDPRVGDPRPSYKDPPGKPYGSSSPECVEGHSSDNAAAETDWPSWHRWMAEQRPWGREFGQEILAEGFIDRWRRQIGDRAVVRSLKHAKARGWHGMKLLELLEDRVDYIAAHRRSAA